MTAVVTTPSWLKPQLLRLWQADERAILRALIVGEAEGESLLGMYGVGSVVLNRAKLPWWWGRTVREVALARHQFSCFWSDWPVRSRSILLSLDQPGGYVMADYAANELLSEKQTDVTGGATHYFNPHVVLPSWASHLVRLCRIGGHDFYGYGT